MMSVLIEMADLSNVGRLEDEALKRKERLKALKQGNLKSVTGQADGGQVKEETEGETLFPKPIFRNYTPKDETLKPGVLPKPNLINIETEIKDQLDSGKPEALIAKEIDLTTLAPQKIDWDLKRDVDKRLKLLERRTQQAIVELIRQRLLREKNSDLAELVSVGSRNNVMRDQNLKKASDDSNGDNDDDDEDDEDEDEDYSNDASAPALQGDDDDEDEDPIERNTKTEISDDDDY